MGTYRQPAIIRNKAGLDAANKAISNFNDGMSDFASKAGAARQEKWCQQNPDDCAKINNSKKDKDDNSSSSSQPARVLTPRDDNKTATGSGPTPKMKPPTPKVIKKGGAQTGGTVQDLYEEFRFKGPNQDLATPYSKNNYKSFYNGED
jgi:hypothetical protein